MAASRAVVGTLMANMGLELALQTLGIPLPVPRWVTATCLR
jgi:hypothetical protein